MPTQLRTLGVRGKNLPVKRSRAILASDFLVGGLMGQFERKYDRSYLVNTIEEFQEIFGNHVTSGFYGWDAVKGFFDNAAGVDAKLYVAALVGNDGTTIDAVVATRSASDTGAQASLKFEAAYKTEVQYGVGGNRTATKITAATRFGTAAAGAVAATAVSTAVLDSVVGIRVGDIVRFVASGGTPGTVYKVITAIDENAKSVTWSGDFESAPAAGEALVDNDVVDVPGFKVQTYLKSISGIETEVETDLGRQILTMESTVTEFFAVNVHATNRYVKFSDLSSSSTLGTRGFATESNPVYLTTGADGTAATTAAHWAATLVLFDNDPIRMLANPESTLAAIQAAGEVYVAARTDSPIWLATIAEGQTKAQLITIGNNFQRSDEVTMVVTAQWLKVDDPFSTSSIAPARSVPNAGHIMGAWVRSIGENGIHFIPAVKTNPLRGLVGVTGDQILSDTDRTDVAEAGVNVIQDVDGVGIVIRNFFTPSTDVAYQFGNGLLMRNFIKVSAVDSLQPSENQPNSINRIREDKMAVVNFLYALWDGGSTGGAPTGETFGQTQDADGNESQPSEHFEVKADLVNNPQTAINAGERNIDIHFTYPAPAGSIEIGVGILLL